MTKYKELVTKLKEIFQIDRPELDFGVYRILNQRSDEINEFLEHRLQAKVKETFKAAKAAKGDGADDENSVYSHLLTFFSRYYDEGDFISQRRYKGDTYAIPYAGEEVMLHWANKDQYYIKSGENFSNYRFKLADGRSVFFKLISADTAKDNRKNNDNDRCFVFLAKAQTITKTDDEGEEYEETITPIEEVENASGESELIIHFEYKALAKGNKQAKLTEQAIKAIEKDKIVTARWLDLLNRMPTDKNPTRTLLEKELTHYTAKNTSDYFIHKDLGKFLRGELDFYIKNEVMHLDDVQDAEAFADIERNLRMIQCLRSIAQELINFLAQIEDFQKKLWLKKKFVVSTDYCVSLSLIDESFYKLILDNQSQIDHWKKSFNLNIKNQKDLEENKYLVIDTAFFEESFKYSLIQDADISDINTAGILFCGENSGALSLISKKYQEDIKAVYIDPPYNTGDDGFLYKDNYRDSSWIGFMNERLSLAKNLIQKDGAIFLSIDDRELYNLRKLLEEIYDDFAFKNIAVKMSEPTGKKMASVTKTGSLAKLKEYGLVLKREKISGFNFERIPKESWDDEYKTLVEGVTEVEIQYLKEIRDSSPDDIDRQQFEQVERILEKIEFTSLSQYEKRTGEKITDDWKYNNAWRIVQIASLSGAAKKLADEKNKTCKSNVFYVVTPNQKIYFIKSGYDQEVSTPRVKLLFADDYLTLHCGDFWSDIKTTGLDNEGYVDFHNGKKPLKLIKRYLTSIVKDNDFVLDFFAGSGTTGEAIIQINNETESNNKYILCEQNYYFDSKLKPRIINTLFHQATTSIVKYSKMESYEDALNNLELTQLNTDLFDTNKQLKDDYQINYMLELESRGSLLSTDDFKKPFDYKMKIAVDSAGAFEEQHIDLVETFNYLIGLTVDQYDYNLKEGYVRVEGTLPTGEQTLVFWRDCEQIDYDDLLKKLSRFDLTPDNNPYDVIYINGDHNVPALYEKDKKEGNAKSRMKLRQIEPEFLSLMFDVEAV